MTESKVSISPALLALSLSAEDFKFSKVAAPFVHWVCPARPGGFRAGLVPAESLASRAGEPLTVISIAIQMTCGEREETY